MQKIIDMHPADETPTLPRPRIARQQMARQQFAQPAPRRRAVVNLAAYAEARAVPYGAPYEVEPLPRGVQIAIVICVGIGLFALAWLALLAF